MPAAIAPLPATATTPITLTIEGMTCASCVSRVERALSAVPGVAQASVNLATAQATLVLHPDQRNAAGTTQAMQAAQATVKRVGYTPTVADAADLGLGASTDASGREVTWALMLCIPLLATMVAMVVGSSWALQPAWQMLLSGVVVWWFGRRFFANAWHALRAGGATMDVLVALGAASAWGLSLGLWWRNPSTSGHELYFESAAVVVALVLLGRWLEARAKGQTLAALHALKRMQPDTVMVKRGGVIRREPLATVTFGDELVVAAGERLAADGTITLGRTHVDESLITGESRPVVKEVGETVLAGSLNVDGQITLRVSGLGANTKLGRMARMVAQALVTKPPIQRHVDRVAAWFVPAVLVLAVVTLLGWMATGLDAATALVHAVSVLVIACPCALGLATPTALMVGTGLAAQRGILVRDAASLEALHQATVIAFDKTGTLTQGRPQLVAVHTATQAVNEATIVRTAAALQGSLNHPLARALQEAVESGTAAASGQAHVHVRDLRVEPGRGVQGTVRLEDQAPSQAPSQVSDQGVAMALGNGRWMDALGVDRRALQAAADGAQAQGHSVSWLALLPSASSPTARLMAVLCFADTVKPEAAQALARLHALGLRTAVLSGDHAGAVQALGKALRIDEVHSGLLPGEKVQALAALGPHVVMVGDGINDAPALASAQVGIAMGEGTEVAMDTAGLTLTRGDLSLIPDAVSLSAAVSRKVKQNLALAFGYNLIALPLAALGQLNPMIAGAAMALSSVSVVTNALALKRWRPDDSR
jgi:P-type Cu+ transporter